MTDTNSKDNQLNVDFSHRLATTDHLEDSLGLMSDRIIGVLHLLAVQFENENVSRMSDQLIFCAIDAAINEAYDIKNLGRAYSKAEHAKRTR
jgi:hypothetical protein